MANSEFISTSIGLIILVAATYVFWRRYSHHSGSELGLAWLPAELRGTKLVYAEKTFRADGEIPIVARLDRGYRNRKGVIILVELKTRRVNRPYFSDVIELSAQRLALRAQTGEVVAKYGFVLIKQSRRMANTAHRVELMSDAEIRALARRRDHLLRGYVIPTYACSKRLCAGCAYAQACEASSGTHASAAATMRRFSAVEKRRRLATGATSGSGRDAASGAEVSAIFVI